MYHKLVRDNIPEKIIANGETPEYRTLQGFEFMLEAQKKLKEEVEEYCMAETDSEIAEELADILEVVYALAEARGISADELDDIRSKKAKKNGRFDKRIYLVDAR